MRHSGYNNAFSAKGLLVGTAIVIIITVVLPA